MEISHEEFVTILKEKDKYVRKWKKIYEVKIKNKKLWDWPVQNQGLKWKTVKNYWVFFAIKKMFFLCMYKMVQISKERYEKCEVEIIDKGRYFWVNRKDLEVESDVANWAQILDNVIQKNKNKYKN